MGHVSFASTNHVPFMDAGGAVPMKCFKPSDNTTANAACCPDPEHVQVPTAIKSNLTAAKIAQGSAGNPACKTCFEGATASDCFDTVQAMWPDHCLQGADGDATFPPSLTRKESDVIVQKGKHQWVDAY